MPLLLYAIHNYTKEGGLPIRHRPNPSPVDPLAQNMPIAATRAVLTVAEAAPKPECARVTNCWAVRPVIAINSIAMTAPPDEVHRGVSARR